MKEEVVKNILHRVLINCRGKTSQPIQEWKDLRLDILKILEGSEVDIKFIEKVQVKYETVPNHEFKKLKEDVVKYKEQIIKYQAKLNDIHRISRGRI